METDLEMSSHEHEKVTIRSYTNTNGMDRVDQSHDTEDRIYSSTSVHNVEPCKPSEIGCFSGGDNIEETAVRADVLDKGVTSEPQVGLEFDTKEAAYSFYREYARSVGFGITIKASRRSKKSGKFIDVKIACSRFGSKRETSATVNPRSCVKTDCKAGMQMKRIHDEKWVICSFIKEHNHEICEDDFYNSIQGRNKQSCTVESQKKGLQLALAEDDINFILEYFMCMQSESPNFFYSLDLQHGKHLKNMFWIDAKARHDYRFFCDVVFFDTFYLSRKHNIPYAPIIGVNHHFQFKVLGCALIGEQDTSTFVWLMKTWCKAVGGQVPEVVITEQAQYLNEAVADVFPGARHCYCLWHVLNELPAHLSHLINQGETFMVKFRKCVYRSWADEDFEKRWWKMVDKFELQENKWIQSLYDDRKKWVPTYMQDTLLAGMSTTERHGSIASFFDKYIHKETTLKEFMEKYKILLQDAFEMEVQADFETRNKEPTLRSHSVFEKQMSTIYTDAIFKKFQVEVLGIVSCQLQKESEDGSTLKFRVDDFEERQDFLVAWNRADSDIHCLCRSFEYRGFLCKHALLVLQMSGMSSIPSHYILKRWTKDAKVTQFVGEVSKVLPCRADRFNELCKQAIRLGEAGSLCEEAYQIAFQALEEVLESCVGVKNSVGRVLESNTLASPGFVGIGEGKDTNMAKSSKKKKTYKKKKVVSEPEGIRIGMTDNYQQLDQVNSRAHTTQNCYVPQQDVRDMELGSRAPTFDGFYGSQHSMQGVGQLSSIPPIRDGYYSQQGLPGLLHSIPACSSYEAQPSMQALGQLGFRAPNLQGCFDIHSDLQDIEQPIDSTQFHGIAPKHLHDKHLSQ
ncbi:protein FAR1-RELATED SEQUENCE 2 isoform X2 [Euphorbia lathyris]|uniref:protein FAR1-RELATED SEQUENCE 2 isoform X2 n=1 Tax=Euphorbia lathyris TaxID=212925 RepID=UPI0033139E7A